MEKSSSDKTLRAFVLSAAALLCMTAAACGFIAAEENTMFTASGIEKAAVVGIRNDESVTLGSDNLSIEFKTDIKVDNLSMLPAPTGNIFRICIYIQNLIESYNDYKL